MSDKVVPVVMSGGSGTRLWPLSTDREPKQFHSLVGDRTMIQETVRRLGAVEGLVPLDPILICNGRHLEQVNDQMAAVGAAPSAVVLEPRGRNTAPVAAVAAALAAEADPEALVLLMPADHVILDAEGFSRTVARSAAAARDRIVVFGVEPTAPETGYGYIESGALLPEGSAGVVREVVRFAEKPDLQTARRYVASGRYLWNAGVFLFSPAVLMDELRRHAPEVLETALAALAAAQRRGGEIVLGAEAFGACPSISIDYAVMEKTDRAAVAPIGTDWADVGSWSELWRLGDKDEAGNVSHGEPCLIDASGSLVWSDGPAVGVIGMSDVVVVATREAVVVLPRDRAQDVKLVVERLKARAAEKPAGKLP